jgi:hypothetical protein
VDLGELLAERDIIHPTQIETVSWSDDQLQITLRGYRWWERPYSDRSVDGRIRLIFGGLLDGSLRPDEFDFKDDEALDEFELLPASDVAWAQPSDWSIFCSGPIPEPLQIYIRLHDFLHDAGSFLTAGDFLNQADKLGAFSEMARSRSFLLARGPACVRDLLCRELERQAVPHNVLSTTADTAPNFLVRLGRSAFLCCSAEAEFDAP